MATVRWTLTALDDLRAISSFLDRISPLLARRFEERITTAVGQLSEFPASGRIVPEHNATDIRELIIGPHRLIYRLIQDDERLDLVRILHARQDLTRLLGNDPWSIV